MKHFFLGVISTLFALMATMAISSSSPDNAPKTYSDSHYDQNGKPVYSENAIDLIEWINDRFLKLQWEKIDADAGRWGSSQLSLGDYLNKLSNEQRSRIVDTDAGIFGKGSMPLQELLDILSSTHLTGSLFDYDGSSWDQTGNNEVPGSVTVMLERMAAEIEALKGSKLVYTP